MSETWALCADCSRWYYVEQPATETSACPVCQQPPVRVATDTGEGPARS